MRDIYFISDTHFNHNNILTFKDDDNNSIRPFATVHEMNGLMIENWNATVKPNDIVVHMGDVAFGNQAKAGEILKQLNGHKRLVFGNHDKFSRSFYAEHFDKLSAEYSLHSDLIFTHRPILLDTQDHHAKIKANAHGHMHTSELADDRYINLCVELTDYTPIHYEEVRECLQQVGVLDE